MQTDRVRAHSSPAATRRLDQDRLDRVRRFAAAPAEEVTRYLETLDREWDIERRLEANAAVVSLLAVGLSVVRSRRWLILADVVPAFLLQHAVQGWCPPIEVFRALGARSRAEIDAERTAIKALRADFAVVDADPERALDAAGKR